MQLAASTSRLEVALHASMEGGDGGQGMLMYITDRVQPICAYRRCACVGASPHLTPIPHHRVGSAHCHHEGTARAALQVHKAVLVYAREGSSGDAKIGACFRVGSALAAGLGLTVVLQPPGQSGPQARLQTASPDPARGRPDPAGVRGARACARGGGGGRSKRDRRDCAAIVRVLKDAVWGAIRAAALTVSPCSRVRCCYSPG